MTSDAMLMLVVAECRHAVKSCNGDVKAKIYAAMKVAKNHWMVLDRDTQLRGALGAVMEHYVVASDEYKRIAAELDSLRKVSAILQAAQVGLTVNLPEPSGQDFEPLGILAMWHEELEHKAHKA